MDKHTDTQSNYDDVKRTEWYNLPCT